MTSDKAKSNPIRCVVCGKDLSDTANFYMGLSRKGSFEAVCRECVERVSHISFTINM